jgi:aquaporin Z
MNMKKLLAEIMGTSWLVIGGCGAAILAAKFPDTGIGFVGVALAFGLSLLTMGYTIGPISGCHLNPAVTLGLASVGRHPKNEIIPYILAQLLGSIVGAGVLYVIANGQPSFDVVLSGFAANGYGEHSPGGFSMSSCLLTEIVATGFFMMIILGATEKNAPAGFAPISIGLAFTLIHLITIPVTNTSVNPARSFGQAIFVGDWAIDQLWMFWFAPILGAVSGAFTYKKMQSR